MEIIGDKEFIHNTKKALKLIKETDKEKYEFVVSRICKIKKNNISFLYPYTDLTYYVGNNISEANTYLYASCLLREAYHAYLVSMNYRKNKNGEFCCYDGKASMIESYQFQFEMLNKMNAPKEVIEAVRNEYNDKIEDKHEIKIVGTREFVRKVKDALLLLKKLDYMSYKVVIQNIGKIIYCPSSHHTYYDAYQEVPTCVINFYDFHSYIENLCCAIFHEACHNKLYVESVYENKEPNVAAGGYSGEMYCLTRQIESLKRLGAPWDLILNYIDYYDYDWWSEPGKLKRIKKH